MKAHRFGAREVTCAFLVPGAFRDILTVTLQPFAWSFPDKHSFTGAAEGDGIGSEGRMGKGNLLGCGKEKGSVNFDYLPSLCGCTLH